MDWSMGEVQEKRLQNFLSFPKSPEEGIARGNLLKWKLPPGSRKTGTLQGSVTNHRHLGFSSCQKICSIGKRLGPGCGDLTQQRECHPRPPSGCAQQHGVCFLWRPPTGRPAPASLRQETGFLEDRDVKSCITLRRQFTIMMLGRFHGLTVNFLLNK